jgi:phage shock protein PspC (stress-responsive transcriptional regulator)
MLKSKTLWAGVSGVLAGIAGYFTGELEVGAALQLVVTSVLAIFLRHGISKVENGD